MENSLQRFDVFTDKTILTSESQIYKTENFVRQTKYLQRFDFFLSKIAESVLKNVNSNFANKTYSKDEEIKSYLIETLDKKFKFLVKFGYQLSSKNLQKKDIVFYKFLFDDVLKQNDLRVANFLSSNANFQIELIETKDICHLDEFNKLYLVSASTSINFPLLSKQQQSIVETPDKNVLVQGVAGSGKTNICISKLIYTACKNYGGKVLYTTFSRGLIVSTKLKVEMFKQELSNFVKQYEENKVEFLDKDHKKALENKFGIYFFSDDDEKILDKIKKIINFLNEHIDYFLIEDLYKKYIDKNAQFADENYFINTYLKNIKNHQLAKEIKKLSDYSGEILYKEIFGMIFGFAKNYDYKNVLSQEEYVSLRVECFGKHDCKLIYALVMDYEKHCKENLLTDNNFASRQLLSKLQLVEKYSVVIADEVQDFSQINLLLFKKIALKVFCVGDALQMINPSYFSFSHLKNLLYSKDETQIAELKNNYRNTKKLEDIIDALGKINVELFGTHSFVLSGQSVDSGIKTKAVFVPDTNFVNLVAKGSFDNFTFVVSNQKQKENLRNIIKNQEILTVSEIKGLERDTIVLYNILSDNSQRWQQLEKYNTNHKLADENSVYRYYFNLFYVGVSRAKQNLFVVEQKEPKIFENFFRLEFQTEYAQNAIKVLNSIISKVEFTLQEYLERVQEFINLEQFENARFTANKISDDAIRTKELHKIDIYQNYIHKGQYREAGIKFWEFGMIDEAKQQFKLSGDETLIELIDACTQNSTQNLNIDIVKYFVDVKDNEIARSFIADTVKRDVENLKKSFSETNKKFKSLKEKKNG